MTAFRRSGDSGYAVPAPSENISANFFRAERDGDSASFPTARKWIQPCLSKRMEKTEIARHTRTRGKGYNPCLSKHAEKTKIARHIQSREKIQPLRLVQRGAEEDRAAGKAVFRRKNAEKGRLFTEFFVDATGNGVMTFEQVGGAGESFVGRKKSAGGDGGGGGGIGAAGCGLILWIGGRSRVNVFVVGGG